MRANLLIGIVVAVAAHAVFLLGFNGRSAAKAKAAGSQEDLIQITMPTLPPEPPENRPEDTPPDEDVTQVAFAPPSLVDIPYLVPNAMFVEEVEPPPPPGLEQSKGVITIPPTRPTGWGRGFGQIFDLSQLDQIPVARVQQDPIYPHEMRRDGIGGQVEVGFIVDVNGDVHEPYVISSTRREFEASALQAVAKWKFAAGRRGGRPVNTHMAVPIIFSING